MRQEGRQPPGADLPAQTPLGHPAALPYLPRARSRAATARRRRRGETWAGQGERPAGPLNPRRRRDYSSQRRQDCGGTAVGLRQDYSSQRSRRSGHGLEPCPWRRRAAGPGGGDGGAAALSACRLSPRRPGCSVLPRPPALRRVPPAEGGAAPAVPRKGGFAALPFAPLSPPPHA